MTLHRHTVARFALAVVLVVALGEWVASAMAYRSRIAPHDWVALREALEQDPPPGPLWLGTPWLGPSVRRELPAARSFDAVAPPDRHGVPRFAVLTLRGDDPREGWPEDGGPADALPDPVVLEAREIGPFVVTMYEQPQAGRVSASFLEARALEVTSDDEPCRHTRGLWRCARGHVRVQAAEVDYRPRRCLAVDVGDGTQVAMTYRGMPLGTRLRGHVGFFDFNGRLRSDAPVRVVLEARGERLGSFVVTDEQGWWPFEIDTSALAGQTADVTLVVHPSLQGTWHAHGYDPRRTRPACIELRALEDAP